MSGSLSAEKTWAELSGFSGLKALAEYRKNPLNILHEAAKVGDLVRLKLGHRELFFCFHPDHIQHILLEKSQSYDKQTPGFQKLSLIVGNGLVTSDGAFWKRQRRIAQPEFTRERIASYEPIMQEETQALLKRWEAYADTDRPLDIDFEMMRLALRIVCRTLLGSDIEDQVETVNKAMTEVLSQAAERAVALVDWPMYLPTPRNLRFKRAMAVLDKIVLGLIEKLRRGEGDHNNLLARLMSAKDSETGESMTDAQLRDEVMTMFLAGHETTANALSWTFYLLSQNPQVHEKLRASLPDENYAAMVLKESMRLFPPAWMFGRCATLPDEIDGFPIKKGAIVFISPYITQRHPALWENPEFFYPERFEAKLSHRWAYIPFGAGPRQCIGKDFALKEAMLILTSAAERFNFRLLPTQKVEPQAHVTLRPKHGLKMFLQSAKV